MIHSETNKGTTQIQLQKDYSVGQQVSLDTYYGKHVSGLVVRNDLSQFGILDDYAIIALFNPLGEKSHVLGYECVKGIEPAKKNYEIPAKGDLEGHYVMADGRKGVVIRSDSVGFMDYGMVILMPGSEKRYLYGFECNNIYDAGPRASCCG